MKTRLLLIVPVLAALAAVPASAQMTRPERPYRGLFGGGARGNYEQSLTTSFGLGGGYDDNVMTSDDSLTEEARAADRSSPFAQGSGLLQYFVSKPRLSLGASLQATASYVPVLMDPVLPQYGSSVESTMRLTDRTQLHSSFTYSYQPSYSLAGFVPAFEAEEGASPIGSFGLGAHVENHSSSSVNVDVAQDLNSRLSATASYGFHSSESASGDYDMSHQSLGAGLRYGIASGLSFRLGFRRSISNADGNGQRYTSDGIDAGLDFTRALSLTRRTKLNFSTGLASVSDGISTSHSVIGEASLLREIGRTWSAALTYGRYTSFVDVFQQPVFSDGITAGISGLPTRRLQLNASVGASNGTVGFETVDNGYTSYYGMTGLTFGVTEAIGLSLDYTYFSYQFDSDVDLPPGYRRRTDHQSVRAFVSWWLPIFQRGGKPSASR